MDQIKVIVRLSDDAAHTQIHTRYTQRETLAHMQSCILAHTERHRSVKSTEKPTHKMPAA